MNTQTHPDSIRATARTFGISRNRIAAAVRAGEISAFQVGRRRQLLFSDDVERWIRSCPGPALNPTAALARARELVLGAIENLGPMRGPVTAPQKPLSRVLDALDDALDAQRTERVR